MDSCTVKHSLCKIFLKPGFISGKYDLCCDSFHVVSVIVYTRLPSLKGAQMLCEEANFSSCRLPTSLYHAMKSGDKMALPFYRMPMCLLFTLYAVSATPQRSPSTQWNLALRASLFNTTNITQWNLAFRASLFNTTNTTQ